MTFAPRQSSSPVCELKMVDEKDGGKTFSHDESCASTDVPPSGLSSRRPSTDFPSAVSSRRPSVGSNAGTSSRRPSVTTVEESKEQSMELPSAIWSRRPSVSSDSGFSDVTPALRSAFVSRLRRPSVEGLDFTQLLLGNPESVSSPTREIADSETLPGMPEDVTIVLHADNVKASELGQSELEFDTVLIDNVRKEPQLTTYLKSPDTYVEPPPPGPDMGKFFERQDFPSSLPSRKSTIPIEGLEPVSVRDAAKYITSLDSGSTRHSPNKSKKPLRRTNPVTNTQSKDHAAEECTAADKPSSSSQTRKKITPPKKFVKVTERTQAEIEQFKLTADGLDKSLAGEGRPNDWTTMCLDGLEQAPTRPYQVKWTANRQPLKSMYARRQTLKTPEEYERGQTPDEFYDREESPHKCRHCSEQFGEEPLSMLVDLKKRIRTCPHFLHSKCCKEICSLKKASSYEQPACPECNASIVDSVLLPNPFKDPDAWFAALDVRRCGRVPRSQVADALVVATKMDPEVVVSILDGTMGGNRHDRYECMDCRYILAKIEKITVGDAMDSMKAFSQIESQMHRALDLHDVDDVNSEDDVDAWILSVTERRCARLPKSCSQSLNEDTSPREGMAALAELGIRRRELAVDWAFAL